MNKSLSVYLAACAGDRETSPAVSTWKKIAAFDRFGIHELTDNFETADLILFVDLHIHHDWRMRALLNHALLEKHRRKVLVYDERDHPWCAIPGLYCSMPAPYFDPRLQRACSYVSNSLAERADTKTEPHLLFSFLGSRSHPARHKILELTHPKAIVEDTSGFVFYDRSNPEAHDRQRAHYATTLSASKFVLCPRGAGTSSFRLFETLAAGRVPVIIGDEWVALPGPDWDTCSLRVPEAKIATIPVLLEAAEARYPRLSASALAAYEEWFAKTVIFHRLVEVCAELLAAQATILRPRHNFRYLNLGFRQMKHRTRAFAGKILRCAGLRRPGTNLTRS